VHPLHDALHYKSVSSKKQGDRSDVVSARSTNFAFIGQYAELPDDVVSTVEYSVRSANDVAGYA
jgi:myosin-crossreactive antigen